jgi:hypothetical protein
MAQAKIYLPKTADNYKEALTAIKRDFATDFGGFTVYGQTDGVVGGWKEPATGEIIEEPVCVVETLTSGPMSRAEVHNAAQGVKSITDEDAVMYTIDGEKFMV